MTRNDKLELSVDLVPKSGNPAKFVKSPYRLAPLELQELSEQLQELQDEGLAECTGEMKELATAALYSVEEVLQSPNTLQKNMKTTCEEANQTPIRMDKSDAWRLVAQDLELSAAKEVVKAMRNLQAIIQCKA
ncbi:hypothetical protein Tco_0856768 [Tanacetum coccineum]|uniref:Uncharacterized protein n=1 Tax=Tanacetum coccineum TaxID=301880 RepID=A0ABQ5B487_9ASTR